MGEGLGFLLLFAGVGFSVWRFHVNQQRAYVRAWRAMIPTLTTENLRVLRQDLIPRAHEPEVSRVVELICAELEARDPLIPALRAKKWSNTEDTKA